MANIAQPQLADMGLSVSHRTQERDVAPYLPYKMNEVVCKNKPAPELTRKRQKRNDYQPEARSGHRLIGDDSNFYCIGGYNSDYASTANHSDETNYPIFKELWQFNYVTRRWKKLKTSGHMPNELASHGAAFYKNTIIVFGGTSVPFGVTSSNSVNICNLKTLQWSFLETTGTPPTTGYGQGVRLDAPWLYVVGGTKGMDYMMDVHRLNLHTKNWEQLNHDISDAPKGRYRHEIVIWNNQIYVLGGAQTAEVFKFNSLPVFNIESQHWSQVETTALVTESEGTENAANEQEQLKGYPRARKAHSCVQRNEDVYICGGFNEVEIIGDVWHLSLQTLVWRQLVSQIPQPVYFHDAVLTSNNTMYTFGGVIHSNTDRTNKIFSIQMGVSSLKELAWSTVIDSYTQKLSDVQYLIKSGVPKDLVERISLNTTSDT